MSMGPASEIEPGRKITNQFLVRTKTNKPVIEELVREVEPGKSTFDYPFESGRFS